MDLYAHFADTKRVLGADDGADDGACVGAEVGTNVGALVFGGGLCTHEGELKFATHCMHLIEYENSSPVPPHFCSREDALVCGKVDRHFCFTSGFMHGKQ